MEAHLPNTPPPSLVAVPGGGGGSTATCMAQNDPHVTLIFWTAHMWGGNFLVEEAVRSKITLQRLLDQSQAGVYRVKRHIPPHFGVFWAYSRTLPQGVELLV